MEIERSPSSDKNEFEGRIPRKNEEMKLNDHFSSSLSFKGSYLNLWIIWNKYSGPLTEKSMNIFCKILKQVETTEKEVELILILLKSNQEISEKWFL